jgi:hypothetical protein
LSKRRRKTLLKKTKIKECEEGTDSGEIANYAVVVRKQSLVQHDFLSL